MRSVRSGLRNRRPVRTGLRNRRSVRTGLRRSGLRTVRSGRLQEALLRQEIPLLEGSLLQAGLRSVRSGLRRSGLRTVRSGRPVRPGLQMIERS